MTKEEEFARAWAGFRPDGTVDHQFRDRLLSLGRAFAHGCGMDAEDLLQRVALRILQKGKLTTDPTQLLRVAERTMRNWRSNARRSGRVRYMTQFAQPDPEDENANVPDEGQAPSSDNPQRLSMAKERLELRDDVFDETDERLVKKGGAIADRARQILALLREGISDTEEICGRLGVDDTKIYKGPCCSRRPSRRFFGDGASPSRR